MTASLGDVAELPFIDIRSHRYRTEPHEVLAEVRQHGGAARSGRGVEILRHQWVVEALVDDRFAEPDNGPLRAACPGPFSRAMVDEGVLPLLEPAKHLRLRRVFMRAFTIRNLQNIGPMIDSVADELIVGFIRSGRCDIPSDFASRLTMEVLCRHIGIPVEDIESFIGTSEKIQRNLMELVLGEHPATAEALAEFESAAAGLHDYVRGLVDRRAADPEDDYISALIQAQEDEGRLTDAEVVWGIVNLVPAGHQTTANQLSLVIDAVLGVSGQWERLAADPGAIDAAIAEATRLHPVVGSLSRVMTTDLEFHGLPLTAGTRVNLNILAAHRDPDVFVDPHRFDIGRSRSGEDLGFGRGRHHCLGHWLASAEIAGGLRSLVSRLTDVEVIGPVIREPYSITGGIKSLPIGFRAR